MIKQKNILVFPCGAEIALEIHRSLNNSTHVHLIGASSVADHGKFVFEDYIGGIPYVYDKNFIPVIKNIVQERKIDAIYPALDNVVELLKRNEHELGCKVIASNANTTAICLSKSKTYDLLRGVVAVPKVYKDINEVVEYPVFMKPDIGYGSRGVKKISNNIQLKEYHDANPEFLVLEYLSGNEFTVDCFTDFKGNLLFIGPRQRRRIANGISVNTATMSLDERFLDIATKINAAIDFNGAWFFQVKENGKGELVLMEISSRMAGSSGVYRAKGINFALLSVYNAFELPVNILSNNYDVELDRALGNNYRITNLPEFDTVYVDFDDTVIVKGKINIQLIALLYHFISINKKLVLITKHESDINITLDKYKLNSLFEEVIHLKKGDEKWKYMKKNNSIFIDDSFSERERIQRYLGIPVFSIDMIEVFS